MSEYPPDTRTALPMAGDERSTLVAYLDWHRETFELKCRGVPTERLSDRSAEPSRLTLHGLVRHLADVERTWFSQRFAGADVADLYDVDDAPDRVFEDLDGDVDEAFAAWRAECERSRRIVDAAQTLERVAVDSPPGTPVSLRRIMTHMITEYARHLGHADLLRERIDGVTGR